MKTKSKLLVALSALTVGTVAAGATATYAWFTTSRTATANFSTITAKNPNGSLEIKISDGKGLQEPTNSGSTASATFDSTKPLLDLSSKDGVVFYSDYDDPSNGFMDSSNNTPDSFVLYGGQTGFVQFALTITNTATSGGSLDVYFDPANSSLAATSDTAANKALASWTRVALATHDGATPTHSMDSLQENGNFVFMNNSSVSGLNSYVNAAGQAASSISQYAAEDHFFTELGDMPKVAAQSGNGGAVNTTDVETYIGTIEGGESLYLTGAIWLAGTCANSDPADGGSINVGLAFAGLDTYVGA